MLATSSTICRFRPLSSWWFRVWARQIRQSTTPKKRIWICHASSVAWHTSQRISSAPPQSHNEKKKENKTKQTGRTASQSNEYIKTGCQEPKSTCVWITARLEHQCASPFQELLGRNDMRCQFKQSLNLLLLLYYLTTYMHNMFNSALFNYFKKCRVSLGWFHGWRGCGVAWNGSTGKRALSSLLQQVESARSRCATHWTCVCVRGRHFGKCTAQHVTSWYKCKCCCCCCYLCKNRLRFQGGEKNNSK